MSGSGLYTFVQSVYPCDEGTYWVTAYPSAFADGATYAFIRDVYYYMDPDALVYTGSKGECVPCPAGTVGVANTGNYTKDWCLPAPEGTTKIIVLLSIFIGVLVGVLLTWQLVKWTMSKAHARSQKTNLSKSKPKMRWIAFLMENKQVIMRLYESFMLLFDVVSDILTYSAMTTALTFNKEGFYVDVSGSVLQSWAKRKQDFVVVKVNCSYDTNQEIYYIQDDKEVFIEEAFFSGSMNTEPNYNDANTLTCTPRNDNAIFYYGAVLPLFILVIVKEGLKVIFFLAFVIKDRKSQSSAVEYFQRNVMLLPLTAILGLDYFRAFFLKSGADDVRLMVIDVLLEDAPQLTINVIFMFLIQSTGTAVNQISLFVTIAMTLLVLGNVAWRILVMVGDTKRDFGWGARGNGIEN